MERSPVPPGSSSNPSRWSQRLPAAALALAGFAIACYLAAYQARIIPGVWEPFFGVGSRMILTSPVARLLPVPDAAVGALAYLFEAIMLLLGSAARWKTEPWKVLVSGFVVFCMACAAIVLVLLQSAVFHAWCTLCLASAVISLLIAALSADESMAAIQTLSHRQAEPYAPERKTRES